MRRQSRLRRDAVLFEHGELPVYQIGRARGFFLQGAEPFFCKGQSPCISTLPLHLHAPATRGALFLQGAEPFFCKGRSPFFARGRALASPCAQGRPLHLHVRRVGLCISTPPLHLHAPATRGARLCFYTGGLFLFGGLPGGEGVEALVRDGAEGLEPGIDDDDFAEAAGGAGADEVAAVGRP